MEGVQGYMNYGDLAPTTSATEELEKKITPSLTPKTTQDKAPVPKEPISCLICNTSMAPSSVVSHVWQQHMQVKPYQCSVCFKDFAYAESTGARKHVLQHNELGGELINNRPKFKELYREWRDKCFNANDKSKDLQVASPSLLKPPMLSISPTILPDELDTSAQDLSAFLASQTTPIEQSQVLDDVAQSSTGTDRPLNLRGRRLTTDAAARQCRKCGAMVNRGNMHAHVWLHYGIKPIKCSECSREFGFSALSGATKHVMEKHENAELIDKREEHKAAVKHMRQVCFPVDKPVEEDLAAATNPEPTAPDAQQVTDISIPNLSTETEALPEDTAVSETPAVAVSGVLEAEADEAMEVEEQPEVMSDHSPEPDTPPPPKVKNGARCRVCGEIAVNIQLHVWRHVEEPIWACSVCTFTGGDSKSRSIFRSHINEEHDGDGVVLDRRPKLTKVYNERFKDCFPDMAPVKLKRGRGRPPTLTASKVKAASKIIKTSSFKSLKPIITRPLQPIKSRPIAPGADTKKMNSSAAIECAVCGTRCVQRGHHIWMYHMQRRTFECSNCQSGFGPGDKGQLVRHIVKMHGNKAKIVDNRETLDEEYKQVYVQCFPDTPAATGYIRDGTQSSSYDSLPAPPKKLGRGRPPMNLKFQRRRHKHKVGERHIKLAPRAEQRSAENLIVSSGPEVRPTLSDDGVIYDSAVEAANQLKWMIKPVIYESFLDKVWRKTAMIIDRRDPTYYRLLMSRAEFKETIDTQHLEWGRQLRAVRCGDRNEAVHESNGTAVYTDVWHLFNNGHYSLELLTPQQWNGNLWKLCTRLQEAFASVITASVCFTPADCVALAPRWYESDVFVLQLEGRQHLVVDEPQERLSTAQGSLAPDWSSASADFDDWLESGDLLYIPKGMIISHRKQERESLYVYLHVSGTNSNANMIQRMLPQIIDQSPNLRDTLPIQYMEHSGKMHDTGITRALQHRTWVESVEDWFNKAKEEMVKISDDGADLLSATFMRDALPPALTPVELGNSVTGEPSPVLNYETKVKLIRKKAQRLVYRPHCVVLVHRMSNRLDGEPNNNVAMIELKQEFVAGVLSLINSYPEYLPVSRLDLEHERHKLALCRLLYENGLIITEPAV